MSVGMTCLLWKLTVDLYTCKWVRQKYFRLTHSTWNYQQPHLSGRPLPPLAPVAFLTLGLPQLLRLHNCPSWGNGSPTHGYCCGWTWCWMLVAPRLKHKSFYYINNLIFSLCCSQTWKNYNLWDLNWSS